MDKLKNIFNYTKLLHKYNTLNNKYETLKKHVGDKAIDKLISLIEEPKKVTRLVNENKRLRKENKAFKLRLKNED